MDEVDALKKEIERLETKLRVTNQRWANLFEKLELVKRSHSGNVKKLQERITELEEKLSRT